MGAPSFRIFGWTHISRYVQAAVVKEDDVSAFVAKTGLRFFAGEIGQAEEHLALRAFIHEVVRYKVMDGFDIVAADAANKCHESSLRAMSACADHCLSLLYGLG